MKTLSPVRLSAGHLVRLLLPLALTIVGGANAQGLSLADKPLFSTTSVPGNLLLSLSVEYPTANTNAYFSTSPYSVDSTYLGYFDGSKCYRYIYAPVATGGPAAASYFEPYGTTANHRCKNAGGVPLWSGNYLNYAGMQSLDIFRWVLTGGNRTIDTAGKTILQKATHSGQGEAGDAPNKRVAHADETRSTPLTWPGGLQSRIWGAGIKMWITGTADLGAPPASITAVDYQDALVTSSQLDASKVYALYMNVRVCDAGVGVESNCVQYGGNYKPEGLMQRYSNSLRYSAFGYLNDSDGARDGGVLRARMAYVGPRIPQPGAPSVANANPEWDPATGIMNANPDPADATATTAATGNKVVVAQSGVLNYLNKFGYFTNSSQASGSYKTYDPVSELYYASLRYLKGQSNVSAYTDLAVGSPSTDTVGIWLDGFPVITDWTSKPSYDPIQYSCQKNFILGIGDVNTHRDANLPGSSLLNWAEPSPQPPQVVADAAATPPVNVTTSTNLVGTMENAGNTRLGRTAESSDNGTYYIAGLAYDAHIPVEGKGIRTFKDSASGVTTISTASTYWLDVLEYQAYVDNNLYYYATKYGGFTVPEGYAYGTPLATDSWYTSKNVLGGNKQPDNYFTASDATQMQSGLTNAFAKIVSANNGASGTALSVPTPNVTSSGATSYAASYDPTTWTGQVIASKITFDGNGEPTLTQAWNARDLLSAAGVTSASRSIVTCCSTNSGAPGLPFTAKALAGTSLIARTNYASFSAVPGVAPASQSIANFIAYLRGDASQEAANGGAYRSRAFRLGDIVNAKPVTVGPPAYPLYDTFNPGYAAFKAQYAQRRNVVYAGANDGMLHAFDGTVGGSTSGSELFGYVPSFAYGTTATAAISGLASLGNPGFVHHYLVDATPGEFDVDLARTSGNLGQPRWRTLLIGGLGKGGKGYYAIDVTDPTTWTSEADIAGKVMWEFADPRLGYTYGTPSLVKTKKYGWVVVFTSGYDNSDGRGYFFFVNPSDGSLLEAVPTPSGAGSPSSPLDLGPPSAYVQDYSDMTADAIYAGDLQGNLWRVDVSASDTNLPYPTAVRIAVLTDGAGNAQPVTTRPLIEIPPNSNTRYVLVGTGRLLADSDIASSQTQSFYAIVDGTSTLGAFYGSVAQPLPSGTTFPITRNALNANTSLLGGIGSSPASAMGWYVDLPVAGGIAQRVNVDPFANQGVVAFVGNLPNGSACSPAGTGTIYGVAIASGQSVLLDRDQVTPVASLTSIPSVLTDITIISVGGNLGIYAGGSNGQVAKAPAQLMTSSGVRQINWRDVPATN